MAVHSTHIPGTGKDKESLTIRFRVAVRWYFEEFCTLCAAFRWQRRSADSAQPLTPMSQPIITDQLLAEMIGTLWVLTKYAELHHVDDRHIDRANVLRLHLERIQQIRRG